MRSFTVHCIDCDSENLAMLNATVKWEMQTQRWVYDENHDPMYLCGNCFCESQLLVEREIEGMSSQHDDCPYCEVQKVEAIWDS